jgi:aspartate-semialdehyde dehydrogenase
MSQPLKQRIEVGVLGATGAVGQRMVSLLEGHPWFDLVELAASGRSAGKPYGEAATWRLSTSIPEAAARLTVRSLEPGAPPFRSKILFSALDASVAGETEARMAAAGHAVVSNSKNHRLDPEVPLVIPEVNHEHLGLIAARRASGKDAGGFIVTNPNCSATGLTMALAPIHERFEIEHLVVATLQAVSGAGYPGLPSMDILDNAVPYIAGEEDKIESEPQKMLGRLSADGSRIEEAAFPIVALVHRVPVVDGHLVSVVVRTRRAAPLEKVRAAWADWSSSRALDLPSAPAQPLVYMDAPDRPQTRLDRDLGRGMSCALGRLREAPGGGFRFSCLSHNTIRGAAGAAVLNAELLVRGRLVL